jgi:hypothetical protein
MVGLISKFMMITMDIRPNPAYKNQEERSPTQSYRLRNVALKIGRCDVFKVEMRQKWRERGGYLASSLEPPDMRIGGQDSN